jgi:hypothetical protein
MSDPGCPDPLLQGGALFGALRVALDLLRRALDARDLSDELFERAEYILLTLFEDNNFKTLSSGPPGPELLAPPEARRLKLNRNPDGSAMVVIDDEKPFRLPGGLSDFLERLASDDGASDDSLVAWQSRASLREWFEKQTDKPVPAKYVNKRVNDLRRQLRAAGIKRDLVYTDDVMGVRFALRRSVRI